MIHHIRHRLHRHTISFGHAFEGLFWVVKSQPNYIVHFTLSTIAIIFGAINKIDRFEWLIVVMLITIGLSIETINTAIEQSLDCVSLEKRKDIKIAKDAAAAAMLIFAIGAIVQAWIIFGPYLIY